jgi:hypothetical protein
VTFQERGDMGVWRVVEEDFLPNIDWVDVSGREDRPTFIARPATSLLLGNKKLVHERNRCVRRM